MFRSLPSHLSERSRWLVPPAEQASLQGEFILYWMHHALRGHENPALDVAIFLARQNQLPLLVYHGLSDQYPFASDRLHAFMLQGHRDAQAELRQRGVPTLFYLQSDGDRQEPLRELTERAAVLVSDEMPTEPFFGWIQQLAEWTTTPISLVDTSCLVALPMLDRAYVRAFEYRSATKHFYAERIERPYVDEIVDVPFYDGPLPMESLDLQQANLIELIGQCQIDHTIAPVVDTVGGSVAGYARWKSFTCEGLARYAERRNDAAIHDGPSRLSAYLHYGMVSPFRIAREAHMHKAEKFLDELLIWREMAFHFCFHNTPLLDTLEALPQWARQTLREHANDPRTANYSWETLARGQTGDPLWNACQRSLRKHGELHNNVRMTWGKAILQWTADPEGALALTLDLNHRYALDGRAPCSYGGILWCFGQFDRPFAPEASIYGTVRSRPLSDHAKRLDLDRYLHVVDRPVAPKLASIAVIGAGMAGLIAAQTLADHGMDVTVFEKSRGVGGRLATRRVGELENGTLKHGIRFDHGAQYFTARDERFRQVVDHWVEDGIVQRWLGRIVELAPGGTVLHDKSATDRYVGVPAMNDVAKHLAQGLVIRCETAVTRLSRNANDRWQLVGSDQQMPGEFDNVIVNCPPVQAIALINGHSDIVNEISQATMEPVWALLFCADRFLDLDFDAAFINQGALSWIARNSAKPGRQQSGQAETWVAHATSDWSREHLEHSADEVKTELLSEFQLATGTTLQSVHYAAAHRWRYAIPSKNLNSECLWDAQNGIGACGDWCGGPRIEGAVLSGMAVAGSLLRNATIEPGARAHSKM